MLELNEGTSLFVKIELESSGQLSEQQLVRAGRELVSLSDIYSAFE